MRIISKCNDTTKSFKRTLLEAFPCDADQAIAVEYYSKGNKPVWFILALLAVFLIYQIV